VARLLAANGATVLVTAAMIALASAISSRYRPKIAAPGTSAGTRHASSPDVSVSGSPATAPRNQNRSTSRARCCTHAKRRPARGQQGSPQLVLGQPVQGAEHVLALSVQRRQERLRFVIHHARMTYRPALSERAWRHRPAPLFPYADVAAEAKEA